ncbi:MAG: hypothetical protein WA919_20315 [Coleofasciculaceae cyanobacterium]
MTKLNPIARQKVNTIAYLICRGHGYEVTPGYDFSTSSHPRSQQYYQIALTIWEAVLNKEI